MVFSFWDRRGEVPYFLRRPLLPGVLLFVAVLTVIRGLHGPPGPSAGDAASLADGRLVALRGVIDGPPERRGFATGYVVRATGVREGVSGPFAPVRGRVAVSVPGRPPSTDWGDEAIFWGRLKPLRGPAAPGAYDERAVLGGRRIFCRLSARPGGGQTLSPLSRLSPLWWVVQARRRFARAFRRLPPEPRAVMAGLLLGDKPAAFPAMQEDFRRSGTIHLLVASGTNVAFVLALWAVAARWVFFLPRGAALALSVPLAFFYAFLAGADAPVMRAAVMAAAGALGLLSGRVDRPVHLIALSALVLLAADPGGLFQAGFQMSFAATLGLALGMPAVEEALSRASWPRGPAPRRLTAGAVRLFAAGALAQLALSPLLIFYFRRMSWVAPLANLVAVPWGTLCLLLGGALFAADLVGLPGAGAAAWAAQKAALGLWRIAAWAGRAPGAEGALPWTAGRVLLLAAASTGTLVLLSLVRRAAPESEREEGEAPPPLFSRRTLAAAGVLWGVSALGVAALRPPRRREPRVLWPAAAGNMAVAVDADGGATVLNPGSAADVGRVLRPYLLEADARARRVLFTFPSKRMAEARDAILSESPGAEVLCAPGLGQACGAWPPGAAREDPGLSWRAARDGVSLSVGGHRFLFMGPREAAASGAWDALSFHPAGSARKTARRLAGASAGRWVLWGRGGAAWEAGLPGVVRRPVRDGFLLWRADGGWEDFVK